MIKNYLRKYREYQHLAKHYEDQYLKANHLLKHFETQFAPGHFYSPYPDLKEIKKRQTEIFNREKQTIPGIDIREPEQLKLLSTLSSHYRKFPYKNGKKLKGFSYFLDHHAYAHTDATVLYCMLSELKPKRIIEIGSGYSSALMLDYKRKVDQGLDITFVEPYPELLHSLIDEIHPDKDYTLISQPLWKVDKSIFSNLAKGDILFIDSTHVSKAGSDVNEIFFEILPLIKDGVIIHIHDVFYPFEYPFDWIKETRAWNEDYLLRAFLHNNNEYKILLFNDFLNLHHKKLINKLLPPTKLNSGGSLWLVKNTEKPSKAK